MDDHLAELEAEREHLGHSREQLTRMRGKVKTTDTSAAADWVSQLSLSAELTDRAASLQDDPEVPLFFGRLDYTDAHREAGTHFYIGRRHVSDEQGDPMVVDWRAPISLPFYRASAREPLGVARRRRFGFSAGAITAFEDEALSGGVEQQPSQLLEAEIESPRTGPMRDIVATIQPEQDVIVRAGLSQSVCVQGAPGTGKTAVGLHRAAFLLYAYREQLERQGVLVVGPNDNFLTYIGDVLPALGEFTAQHTTVAAIAQAALSRAGARFTISGVDDDEVARLKGDPRWAQVLEAAVWAGVRVPGEPLVVPRGARRWRVHPWEAEEIVTELRNRGVRYGAARAMLPQRLAHAVLVKMEEAGDSPDDRTQNAVARSREVKAYASALWPAIDPAKLLHKIFSDDSFRSACCRDTFTDLELSALGWHTKPKSLAKTPWTLAEAIMVDEVLDLVDRTRSLGHVVADEAQDLSPMMLRAVGRRCSTGSATVLGDVAQATTPWATDSWAASLAHLGKPEAHVEELVRGFRVPGEVIEYAARLLPVIAPGLRPPEAVRRTAGQLRFERVSDPSTVLTRTFTELTELPVGSVGVIVADAHHCDALASWDVAKTRHLGKQVAIVPASLAKGLEFDHVLLVEPTAIVAGEAHRLIGLRRLYVCLTRAVTTLVVLHSSDLPIELDAAPDQSITRSTKTGL